MTARNTDELIADLQRVDAAMKAAAADLKASTNSRVAALRESMISNGATERAALETSGDLYRLIDQAIESMFNGRRSMEHAEQVIRAGVRKTRVRSASPRSRYLML